MKECPEWPDYERRHIERRCQHRYVFLDRRTGFDRRRRPRAAMSRLAYDTLLALRDNPVALRVLLVVVNALNLIDFGLTLNALSLGASEANPLMATLLDVSPVWAGIFKAVAVVVATAIVWGCRRYRKALVAAVFMVLVFSGVFVYHIVGLTFYC